MISSAHARINNDSETELRYTSESHSCEHCQKIVLHEKFMKSWNYMVKIPHTKREARAAAMQGCPLFELFAQAFVEGTTVDSIRLVLQAIFSPPSKKKYLIPSPLVWNPLVNGENEKGKIHLRRIAYIFSHLRSRHLFLTFCGESMSIHYLMWRNISRIALMTAFSGTRALQFPVHCLRLGH